MFFSFLPVHERKKVTPFQKLCFHCILIQLLPIESKRQTNFSPLAFLVQYMVQQLKETQPDSQRSIQKFQHFDSTSELWKDCWSRFQTFTEANSMRPEKQALVFLTNQSCEVYMLIDNYPSQLHTPTTANKLSMDDINEFMSQHYDPKRFVLGERSPILQ